MREAHNRVEMIGRSFGRLKVLCLSDTASSKNMRWSCICQCGNRCVVLGKNLRMGLTSSCGCLRKEKLKTNSVTHGMSKSLTYRGWRSMITRCTNPGQQSYRRYGAVGIRVCTRWMESFEKFLEDMGLRPEGMTLDRIDPFGNYEPSNCRWATPEEQVNNTRGQRAIAIRDVPIGLRMLQTVHIGFLGC